MTIAITCSCSAKLEIDDKFAGQTVTCPDCQATLEVPESGGEIRQTSGLALASVLFAMVGAFTLVCTMLAILFGLVALWRIRNEPKRLAGKNFALAGIVAGAVLTLVSLVAYTSSNLFGLDVLLRQSKWAGMLAYPSSLEIEESDAGFRIKRPSRYWGVFHSRSARSDQNGSYRQSFLMVNPARPAHVFCLVEESLPSTIDFSDCKTQAKMLLQQLEIRNGVLQANPKLSVDLDELDKGTARNIEKNGVRLRLWLASFKKSFRGRTNKYLLRLIVREQKRNDESYEVVKLYVLAGGAPAARFESVKSELVEALDSFQLLDFSFAWR